MRRAIFVSAFAHGLVAAALLWMPAPEPAAMPGVVTVDLVSMAAPASAGKPAPPPKPIRAKPVPPAPAPEVKPVPPAPKVAEIPKPEPPKPEPPKPKPEPPKPPPPPPPKNETVIPKTPQKEPEKAKEKPEPQPKPEPEPKPRVEPKPPPKEVAKAEPPKPAAKPPPPKPQPKPQESYDDVLADLRAERGESRPDRVERPTRTASAATPGAGGTAPKPGAPAAGTTSVTPEVAAWLRAARLHVGQAWVVPAGLRNEPLQTQIEVELDAQGKVLSDPKVVRRSGNPWYDESVVRAIQKASPLPPPPEPGMWRFVFDPEDLG